MASNINDQIEDTALGPASVSLDGQSVQAQRIADQIEADRYRSNKTARQRNHLGLIVRQIEPGSAGL